MKQSIATVELLPSKPTTASIVYIYIALNNGIYGRVNSKYLWDTTSILNEVGICVATANDGAIFCSYEINPSHLDEINKVAVSKQSRQLSSFNEGTTSTYWSLFMDHEFNIDDWIIIASQSADITNERTKEYRNLFFPLILFSLLLVIFLSSVIIRKKLNVINKLIEGTRKISENNFNSTVDIDSKDEFGELAKSFNKMAYSLKSINNEYQKYYEVDQIILASSEPEKIIESVSNCLNTIIEFESFVFINHKNILKPLGEFYYRSNNDAYNNLGEHTKTKLDDKITLNEIICDLERVCNIQKLFKDVNNLNHIKIINTNNIYIKHLKNLFLKNEKTACIIPISHDSENWTYIIATFKEQIFDDFIKTKLTNFSNRICVAFQALNRESVLRYRAEHDLLTHLPNRSQLRILYEKKLLELDNKKTGFALIFVDLDRFKQINDNYGHIYGDKLLKEFAYRIKNILEKNNYYFFRLSGDEFVIVTQLLEQHLLRDTVSSFCTQLINLIQQPYHIDNNVLTIGSSIGATLIPENSHSFENSLRFADIAMYISKNHGGNQYTIYEEGMSERLLKQKTLEEDLTTAIEKRQIEIHYQVKVDTKGEKIIGFEALFRWSHRNYGFISPFFAIEIAEKTGAIHKLGELVFELSLRQWQAWKEKDYEIGTIAINISPLQLLKDGFIDFIIKTVERYPLVSYSMIELEVTENVMINDTDRSLAVLNEIRELGISIAIDDFGSGYSSLSYLLDIPASTLKIDRSFVMRIEKDKNALELLSSLISLGKSMNYKIVAEGVETRQQAKFLAHCDTDILQGYLFSKPLPAELVEQRFFNNITQLKMVSTD
jgi:diguanylate cyclase (GGDEF)-like protein